MIRRTKMKRRVSAMDVRKKFGEILESVFYRGDEIVIERAGKTMGVIVPADRYEAIERSRQRLFELVEKNWERNKDVPYERIERDVDKAVGEVRRTGSR